MALTVYVNVDTQDLPYPSSGVDWVEFSSGNDQLIFTNGSPDVQDGQATPTQQELISAGVIATGAEIIVSDYLLLDTSVNLLKSIDLMGNLDSQYVIAFDFDGATATEPVLEVWDDINLNTVDTTMLGGGNPTSSFIRGATTTNGSAGVNWASAGSKLAGSSSGNFLYLNDQNGALTTAKTLYATLCIVVPASQTSGFSANPVFVVKWLSN